MPIILSPEILTKKDALASQDLVGDGGVVIQGEDEERFNPFARNREDWGTKLDDFGEKEA
jgi:hypothetical protein